MEDPTIALLFAFGGMAALAVIIFAFLQRGTREKTSSILPTSSLPQAAETTKPKIADILALLPRQFIVLDLETTGLSSEINEIIEIGAIRAKLDDDRHATFQALVKPDRKVPRKITQMTGITQEMIDQGGLPLAEALRQFVEFIGDLPIVTFNADFDMAFLQSAARKHGIKITNSYTCALKRARRAWPGLPSYRLADLAKMGHLSEEDTHRALGDCQRALIVFISATSVLGQKVRWTKPSLTAFEPQVQKTG